MKPGRKMAAAVLLWFLVIAPVLTVGVQLGLRWLMERAG